MTPTGTASTALITGGSSGIGEAIARQLVGRGANLILVPRSEAKLRALADELAARHGVQAQVLGAALEREVTARGLQVDLPVNNAGLGFLANSAPKRPRTSRACSP